MTVDTEQTPDPVALPPFRADLYTLDPFALRGSKCSSCHHTTFPVRPFCPKCRTTTGLDEVALPTSGTVHTFTVIRQAPPGVEVPYVLARVELADGIRVMAQVRARTVEDVAIGKPVTLVPASFPTASAEPAGGYAFTLNEEESA
ncbi:hypothetical protein R1CP_38140 (plasmid) [Rhodococcus opacus]|uniref:Zn-ribbon domain-containing OB-fold protein n=1 Tax=Rhodococcus opacus TaxID=37919 RepID=A0A1B1KI00_RHOOP|nr:Zn-ribbon domain-containing OB-fold protein [Rhodococcus opacus]ANS32227.1 hypothetical protein R1CP_38140 [Rhodococcus opacus]